MDTKTGGLRRKSGLALEVLEDELEDLAGFVFALASMGLAQPPAYVQFNPAADCARMPSLIRDAAKDAGIDIRTLCFIGDRAKFASKAGEAFAHDLDRIGKMVRVVVPFGHLLLVNGTEPAVQMAVRYYDSANKVRVKALQFTTEQYFRGPAEVADDATEAIRALRKGYAIELARYKEAANGIVPRD